ncbi:MAG: DUF2190 family protein [Coprobacillus sp.]|nr:DUF2190 family protein [Coprobacillus sp.]
MSKASFWQRGEAIDYVNTTDDVIEAGEVIMIGSHAGVAGMDIAPGETGSLMVEGVYAFPKGSDEIEAGADISWDGSEASAASSGDGDEGGSSSSAIGYAVEAAAASDTTVKVKLLG